MNEYAYTCIYIIFQIRKSLMTARTSKNCQSVACIQFILQVLTTYNQMFNVYRSKKRNGRYEEYVNNSWPQFTMYLWDNLIYFVPTFHDRDIKMGVVVRPFICVSDSFSKYSGLFRSSDFFHAYLIRSLHSYWCRVPTQ